MELTATNVPGRKTKVTTATILIALLSNRDWWAVIWELDAIWTRWPWVSIPVTSTMGQHHQPKRTPDRSTYKKACIVVHLFAQLVAIYPRTTQ
jgi:hypothetical protein